MLSAFHLLDTTTEHQTSSNNMQELTGSSQAFERSSTPPIALCNLTKSTTTTNDSSSSSVESQKKEESHQHDTIQGGTTTTTPPKIQRYAVFDPIICERAHKPTAMILYPFSKIPISTPSFYWGENVYISALPLAQALISGSAMAAETAKEDRIKASRFICRFSVFTGKALSDTVKRNTQDNTLVVRADGLWNFLTSVAPNKISMAVRMRVYETARAHFGGPPLPADLKPMGRPTDSSEEEEEDPGTTQKKASKKENIMMQRLRELEEAETMRIKEAQIRLRKKKAEAAAESKKKADDYRNHNTSMTMVDHEPTKKKRRQYDDMVAEEEEANLSSSSSSTDFKKKKRHATSLKPDHHELALNEAILASRIRLDAQAKDARAVALRDMIRKEEILEEGRRNLIRALEKELQLRKEIAAI